MWGQNKAIWSGVSPEGKGRGAVNANNEILPEEEFRQKRFPGGYAKRCGEWNRVVYDNVIEEPPPEYKKKEGWLFVCGYIDTELAYSYYSRRRQDYSGNLDYDVINEIFTDKWTEDTTWTLSDSVTTRRLSDDLKKVGHTLISDSGYNDWNYSSGSSLYGSENYEEWMKISYGDLRYYNMFIFPRAYPYIKRFEYQSITKSSLDQTSSFKRNTEYYSKAIKETYETPRQNLADLYNSLENLNTDTYDAAGKCPNCGHYYSTNDSIESLMNDPTNLLKSNVSAYDFILFSIDKNITNKVTNQLSNYYINIKEFNEHQMDIFSMSLDYDEHTYNYLKFNYATGYAGFYSGMNYSWTNANSFRYTGKYSDCASTLMENSDITQFEYDYRIHYASAAFFLPYDIVRIRNSNEIEIDAEKTFFWGYDNTNQQSIAVKHYAEKNTFAYHSYFDLYTKFDNWESYTGLKDFFVTDKKQLTNPFKKVVKPFNAIENIYRYYDGNIVDLHNCKNREYLDIPLVVSEKYQSGSQRIVGSFRCPGHGDPKSPCPFAYGWGHYYVVNDKYIFVSNGLGKNYNNRYPTYNGVQDEDNFLDEETAYTFTPSEKLLEEYNKENHPEEYDEIELPDYNSPYSYNPFYFNNINDYNFNFDYFNEYLERGQYIPQTFFSIRRYETENKTNTNNDTVWKITGNEEEGYTLQKIYKMTITSDYNTGFNDNTIKVTSKDGDLSEKSEPLYKQEYGTKKQYLEDGETSIDVYDTDNLVYTQISNINDLYCWGSFLYSVGGLNSIDTGYSPNTKIEYVRTKGRPYTKYDYPVFNLLFRCILSDFLSSEGLSKMQSLNHYYDNEKLFYLAFPEEQDENTPSLFTPIDNKISNIIADAGVKGFYYYLGEASSGHPGTASTSFICMDSNENTNKQYNITWLTWWEKLGQPNGRFVCNASSLIENYYGNAYGIKIDTGYTYDGYPSMRTYKPNLSLIGDLRNNEENKKLITHYYKNALPDFYELDFTGTAAKDGQFIYVAPRIFEIKRKQKLTIKAPRHFIEIPQKYWAPMSLINNPIHVAWEKSQTTLYGCTPYGENGNGEDENGIKYSNKYFIFDESDEQSPWKAKINYPNLQQRFWKNQTPYKNFLLEGVYPSGDTDTFIMVNAWMTDIEEGFSGIELKVEGFTNLADGKCTTGFNVPCDTAMISKVSLEDLSIKEHANIFTQDDDSGYTTNKGIFPVLKSLWQQRKTDGSYGDKMAIFAIETQCMIEGPEYYFSYSPDKLPPGFEQDYKGYLSRGLLISVASGGTFTNYFVDKECGFFNYFKEQNKKRYPINARRAYDDEPEDMRKEVGYYWDFEEAFGPYEIGSPYTFETQLAGKMSFAVTLGDRTTHILFMLAYDIDKWPTLPEDTPTEYEHPEILPEEEYSFRSAFLTAEFNFGVTSEPKIPHPFKDFQIQKTLRPLVTSSRNWTSSKLKNAGREFFVDDTKDEDASDFGDKGYKGDKKEYEGITIPKSLNDKKWGERVWYEFDESTTTLEDLKINRGVIRLVRWRTYTWKEKKVDKNGNLVKDNDGKQKYIEHQDAIAECAVAYTDGQTTKPDNDYVDLFYTGKDTILLRFYRDDSKLETKKKKNAVEGEDYKNVEICVGDVCVENMAIPELMVWQKATKDDTGKVSASKDYLLKLSKLGIFDVITLQQPSEEEDPDESFEVLAIPVVATAAYQADDRNATSKTYFCVSKDCKNWEITGVIGDGFLSHTAAGDKSTAPSEEEKTK